MNLSCDLTLVNQCKTLFCDTVIIFLFTILHLKLNQIPPVMWSGLLTRIINQTCETGLDDITLAVTLTLVTWLKI